MKYPHLISKCIPQRWIVSIECFLCLTISYTMRFCLSLAMTQMTEIEGAKEDPHACPFPSNYNKTKQHKTYEFHWTSLEQGYIHQGMFYGYLATQIVGGVLGDLCDHKVVMLTGFITTAFLTLISPFVVRTLGMIAFIILRVAIGMAQGVFYNSLHAVTAHWIPIQERGLLGTLVFSGVQFGNALNCLFSGILLAYFDWPVVFYCYGIIALMFAVVVFFTTYTYPKDNPYMSDKEKEIFEEHQKTVDEERIDKKKVPVKAILTSIPVWAIVFAMLGQDWAFYSIVVTIPTYINSVLHINIEQNGAINALVYIVLWLIGMLSGWVSDFVNKKQWIPLTWNRRILYLLGMLFPALGFVGVSYSECNIPFAISSLVIGLSTLGFFYPSVKVNPMDLSPNFAGSIGSLANTGGCLSGVIVPFVNGALTPNGFKEEWRVYFWISFVITLLGGLSFFLLASAEIQPFNEF
ncbi:hypothetical protein O3M35_011312 [Rhynocoris fuscipes]|uniref:Major facilitator superfamily (MFS) profile domain-containing protein n=1 Tax=Rhynocoris fuscipes TaxID=488301 RepID=A0AAW1D1W5_9HEMI